jgi:hypothetical protein
VPDIAAIIKDFHPIVRSMQYLAITHLSHHAR